MTAKLRYRATHDSLHHRTNQNQTSELLVLLRSNRKYHRDNPYSRQPACCIQLFHQPLLLLNCASLMSEANTLSLKIRSKLYRYLTSTGATIPNCSSFFHWGKNIIEQFSRISRSICRILFRLNRKTFFISECLDNSNKNNFIRYWKNKNTNSLASFPIPDEITYTSAIAASTNWKLSDENPTIPIILQFTK